MPSVQAVSLAVQREYAELERRVMRRGGHGEFHKPIVLSTGIAGLEVKESDWSAWNEAFEQLWESPMPFAQTA